MLTGCSSRSASAGCQWSELDARNVELRLEDRIIRLLMALRGLWIWRVELREDRCMYGHTCEVVFGSGHLTAIIPRYHEVLCRLFTQLSSMFVPRNRYLLVF